MGLPQIVSPSEIQPCFPQALSAAPPPAGSQEGDRMSERNQKIQRFKERQKHGLMSSHPAGGGWLGDAVQRHGWIPQ